MLVARCGEHQEEINQQQQSRKEVDGAKRPRPMRRPHRKRIEHDERTQTGGIHEDDSGPEGVARAEGIDHFHVQAVVCGRRLPVVNRVQKYRQRDI